MLPLPESRSESQHTAGVVPAPIGKPTASRGSTAREGEPGCSCTAQSLLPVREKSENSAGRSRRMPAVRSAPIASDQGRYRRLACHRLPLARRAHAASGKDAARFQKCRPQCGTRKAARKATSSAIAEPAGEARQEHSAWMRKCRAPFQRPALARPQNARGPKRPRFRNSIDPLPQGPRGHLTCRTMRAASASTSYGSKTKPLRPSWTRSGRSRSGSTPRRAIQRPWPHSPRAPIVLSCWHG